MYFGDFDTTETVNIPFNTFSSDDPSASVTVTDLAAGDIEIHKDGSTTQRSSDNGVTVSINFDSVTGNHMVHIDLSDNTDAGFYAAGSRYQVRLEGITVDGATLNVWIGTFSIGCTLRPTTAGRTLDIQSTGEVDANLTMMGGVAQSATDLKDFADAGYDPATNKVQGVVLTDTCTTNTDMRGTDNASLASVLGAAAGADISADIAEIKAETATIVADTNELQTDDTPTALAALDAKIDTIDTNVDSVLTDTNELQTDWANAGRLDTLIDQIITDIAALNDIAVSDITGVEVDNDGTAISLAGAIKLLLSAASGKVSGAGTTTVTIRDIADSKDRIVATVDADGNRSAIGTRDAT